MGLRPWLYFRVYFGFELGTCFAVDIGLALELYNVMVIEQFLWKIILLLFRKVNLNA